MKLYLIGLLLLVSVIFAGCSREDEQAPLDYYDSIEEQTIS